MRVIRLLAGLIATALATGCAIPLVNSPPVAPPGPSIPPRPANIPLDQIDPCLLLVEGQIDVLRLSPGVAAEPTGAGSDQICYFRNVNYPDGPIELYGILVDRSRGAEQFVGSGDARIVDVSGFSAVEYLPVGAPVDNYCKLSIDVAQGQNLAVDYAYYGSALAMTRELGCDKAHTAAEMAVRTLLRQAGG